MFPAGISTRGALAFTIALVAAAGGFRARTTDLTAPALVERTGRSVEADEQEFSAVVCEERQALLP